MRHFARVRFAFSAVVVSLAASLSLPLPPAFAANFFWANPRPTGSDLGGVDFESANVGYAVGEFGTTLRTTDAGATWEDLTDLDAFVPHLDDVRVLAPGHLLAAGESPGLYTSVNGGASWTPVANPGGVRLRNLFALDATTFFAVGDAGKILRSTDAGVNWTLLATIGNELVDQFWLDSVNGYIVGESRVRRTTNGGTTWTAIPGINENVTFFPGDVQFLDALTGWIILDFEQHRTTNGGASWVKLTMPFANMPIYSEEALLVNATTRLIVTEAEGAEIWKTTNDGTNWTKVYENDATRGITDLHRTAGGPIVAVSSNGDLLRSVDEGATWQNFTVLAGSAIRENLDVMDIHSSGLGFAGGYGIGWLQTTDAGRHWVNAGATPGLNGYFSIEVRDPLFILAGGIATTTQSDVRRTTDGGATWTTHPLAANFVGSPQDLAALPDGTCYTGTYGGQNINFMYRSTDGGTTWHPRGNGLPNKRIFTLFFLDSQNGFVGGGEFGSALISRTTDGGGVWTPMGTSGLLIGMIQDMHWFSASVGLVVGDSRIQRTTNGGSTWTTVQLGSVGASMDFFDGARGVADGFIGEMFETADAGVTWTPRAMPMSSYIGDVAATATGFYAVTSASKIFGFEEAAVGAPEIALGGEKEEGGVLAVWPNPVRLGGARVLSFQWEGRRAAAAGEVVEARLFDVGGRLLHRTVVTLNEAGRGTFDFARARVGAGVAFLEVRTADGERASRQVALIR